MPTTPDPPANRLNDLIGIDVTIVVAGIRPAVEQWHATILDIDRSAAGDPVLVARILNSTDGRIHLFPWHAVRRIVIPPTLGGT